MLPPKVLGEKSFLASYRLSSSSSGRAWGTGGCPSVQSCSKCSLPSAQLFQAERPVEAAASPAPVLAGFMWSASAKTPPQQVPGEGISVYSHQRGTTVTFLPRSEPQPGSLQQSLNLSSKGPLLWVFHLSLQASGYFSIYFF